MMHFTAMGKVPVALECMQQWIPAIVTLQREIDTISMHTNQTTKQHLLNVIIAVLLLFNMVGLVEGALEEIASPLPRNTLA